MLLENQKFPLGLVKNIVGKGENAGYQHFFLFSQCFQKTDKSGLCIRELKVFEEVTLN